MVKTKRKDDKYKTLNIILISCIILVILRKIIIAILGLTILLNVIAIVKDIDNLPKLYVFPLIAKAQLVKNQRPLL